MLLNIFNWHAPHALYWSISLCDSTCFSLWYAVSIGHSSFVLPSLTKTNLRVTKIQMITLYLTWFGMLSTINESVSVLFLMLALPVAVDQHKCENECCNEVHRAWNITTLQRKPHASCWRNCAKFSPGGPFLPQLLKLAVSLQMRTIKLWTSWGRLTCDEDD